MEVHGLNLAIMIKSRRVEEQNSAKYLGVYMDKRSFTMHIDNQILQAERVEQALGRLMLRKRRPTKDKRRVLAFVCKSVFIYGVEVSVSRLNRRCLNKIESLYRRWAVAVVCAYWTVSREAANVTSSTPPIELVGEEWVARGGGVLAEEMQER